MISTVSASLAEICRHFTLPGRYESGGPHGNGHINDTFAVTLSAAGSQRRVILQRINTRVFRDVPALMENISRVSRHLGAKLAQRPPGARREALTLIPTRSGAAYHQTGAGACWRAYAFVENAASQDVIQSARQAHEAAFAFGQFQRDLLDLPGPPLHETIPGFHDTPRRLRRLEEAIAANAAGRAASAAAEIDFARSRGDLAGVLLDLNASGAVPARITHNDTKLNNVMLDLATGHGVCVIDLDTVMPGLSLYDFGDMVRSATNTAAEDETDLGRVHTDLGMFEALVAGYLKGAGDMLNGAEIAHLVVAARLITLEIGIRFLTDFLEGDVYFKIRRPAHNLDRCRCQFALLRDMETKMDAMQRIVDSFQP